MSPGLGDEAEKFRPDYVESERLVEAKRTLEHEWTRRLEDLINRYAVEFAHEARERNAWGRRSDCTVSGQYASHGLDWEGRRISYHFSVIVDKKGGWKWSKGVWGERKPNVQMTPEETCVRLSFARALALLQA